MNKAQLLFVILILLVAALCLGGVWLVHASAVRLLRERVAGVGAAAAVPEVAIAGLPSIRVGRPEHGPMLTRVFRILRYNPEIPQEKVVPWPVVLVASLLAAGLVALRGGDLVGSWLAPPAALVVGLLVARGIFGWQHARYCQAIFLQMPDALGLMVRAISAGLPMAEALRSIAREMPAPTRDEFSRIVGDMAIGRPVDAALMRLYQRTGLTEYAFLAVTLGLQAQTGGALAETLDNLADTVRKRVMLTKRASALAAEAKMQAGLLVALPFIAALAMSFLQPYYISTFRENPTGQKMGMIALGLMGLGLLTIRWLIRKAGKG